MYSKESQENVPEVYRGVSGIHFSNLEGHMSRSRLIESVLVDTKYTLKAYIVKVMQCKGKFYLEDLKRAI